MKKLCLIFICCLAVTMHNSCSSNDEVGDIENPGGNPEYQYNAIENEVYRLLNDYRVSDTNKVKKLILSDGISKICGNHVDYTLGVGYINHLSRAERRAAIKALYPGSTTTAEIVSSAITYNDDKQTALGIINGYKSSPDHNGALINGAFTHVGISVKTVGVHTLTCLNFLQVK